MDACVRARQYHFNIMVFLGELFLHKAYGTSEYVIRHAVHRPLTPLISVTRWQGWVLDQKAGIEHIKYAYEQGINAFE